MAAPAWARTGTILAVQNGTADATYTLPTHAAGDIILLRTMRRSLTNTLTTPSGWTLIAGPWNSTAERHYLFGLRCASAAETNPSLDWAATSGDWYTNASVYTGAIESGTAWEVVGSTQTGTGSNPTLTGITSLTNDSLIVGIIGYGDNNNTSAWSWTPANMSALNNAGGPPSRFQTSGTGADGTIAFADLALATAGATGDVAISGLTVSAGDGWGAIFLALIPPAAGVQVTPAFAAARALAISPGVQLGSLSITPAMAVARALGINPTVQQGSLSITPGVAAARALAVDPTVEIAGGGGVNVTPEFAAARALGVDPTIQQGSLTITPAMAAARALGINPTTQQGSLAVTPAAALARALAVSPAVAQSSVSVTPAAASARALAQIGNIINSGDAPADVTDTGLALHPRRRLRR